MLIVAGAAVALALVLVVVLKGGSSGGGSSPSSGDTAAAAEEAHKTASKMVLSAQDWGPGFTPDNPYEADPFTETTIRDDCEDYEKPVRAGTLAAIQRSTINQQEGLNALSRVGVYAADGTAKGVVADVRDVLHRCPNQHTGKARWDNVHEAVAPQLSGFDEIVSDEGRLATYDDGTAADEPYVLLTGRSGKIVMTAFVGGPRNKQAVARKKAADALTLMRSRYT